MKEIFANQDYFPFLSCERKDIEPGSRPLNVEGITRPDPYFLLGLEVILFRGNRS